MPKEDEQDKERLKISMRVGEAQVELEGTYDNIKKLMDKDLVDFAKGLEGAAKHLPPSTETAPKVIARPPETPPRTIEVAPKEKAVPPPTSKPLAVQEPSAKKPGFFSRGKKTEKMEKQKNSWKPLALVLVLVCIVLSAGLVSALAVYLPRTNDLESQVIEKDTNIAALSSTVSSLNMQVATLQSYLAQNATYIDTLKEGVDILNAQIAAYLNIIYLNTSAYLLSGETLDPQNASEYTVIFQYELDYAGYVGVSAASTSNTTYIQVLYSSYGVNYNHNVTVATSGTAYFPVLPGTVEVRLGNTDVYTGDMVNATVTAIYYY